MLDAINSFLNDKKDSLLRIVGVADDIDDYLDDIATIAGGPNACFVFEKTIEQDFALINNTKGIIPEYKLRDLQDGLLVKNLDNIGFFNFVSGGSNRDKLKTAMGNVFQAFYKLKLTNDPNSESVKINTTRSFLAGLLAFAKQYIKDKDYGGSIALFLGEFKKNDEYIMQLMRELGSKVIYINGEHDLFYLTDGILVKQNKLIFVNKYINDDPVKVSGVIIESFDYTKDLRDIFKTKTDVYKENNTTFIPHYFQIVTGVRDDNDETVYQYLNNLLDLRNELKPNLYFTFLNLSLKMNVLDTGTAYLRNVEMLLGSDFNVNNLVNHLNECGILLNEDVAGYVKKALKKYIKIITAYLKSKNIKNIAEYINNIFSFIRKNITRLNNILKEKQVYICYGNLNDVSVTFLYFLGIVGFNVFYFSLDKSVLEYVQAIEGADAIAFKTENYKSTSNIDFPESRLISRRTVAFKASEEITRIISTTETGIFKPYQMNGNNLINNTLILTCDEINILLKERSMLRPNFNYDDKNIYLPNIFAKINGIEETANVYLETIEKNRTLPNTQFICTNKAMKSLPDLKFGNTAITPDIFDANMQISFEKLSMKDYYKFNHIRLTAQQLFIDKLNYLISPVHSKDIFLFEMNRNNILLTVNLILNIEKPDIAEMLHTFDYVGNIPKILIFNNIALNNKDAMNLSIFLAFVNLLGFDVVIYSPTGYVDIEKYLCDTIYTQHTLNAMNNTIEFKKPPKQSRGLFGLGI